MQGHKGDVTVALCQISIEMLIQRDFFEEALNARSIGLLLKLSELIDQFFDPLKGVHLRRPIYSNSQSIGRPESSGSAVLKGGGFWPYPSNF